MRNSRKPKRRFCRATLLLACLALAANCSEADAQKSSLARHWKLNGDLLDSSGLGIAAKNHGAVFTTGKNSAAKFDGVRSYNL